MSTSFKTAADFKKSLESRLQKMATSKGENLQRLRRKVAFDRLLARLFASEEQCFFLKGGYAMELRFKTARATKDIDLTSLKRPSPQSQPFRAGSRRDSDRPESLALEESPSFRKECFKREHASSDDAILEELRARAEQDLGDFFVFRIEKAVANLNNAPYGGARYPVIAFLDGKLFVRFQLDVGSDAIVTRIEQVQGTDWLNFCGITPPIFPMISVEQQFAEKLHAYTLPRSERPNTRVKDLVDMVLLAKLRSLNVEVLKEALRRIFKIRETHPLPQKIDAPPLTWRVTYEGLAKECSLKLDLEEAFRTVENIYAQVHTPHGDRK